MSGTAVRPPLRRDADKNREKIPGAALVVFAEHGLEGSVEEVARVAGAGMGTLYRRFPTKQSLIDELVGKARRELLTLARKSAELRDGSGLEKLLVLAGQLQAGPLGCLQRIWDQSDAELAAMEEFRDIVGQLLSQGQDHGRIRRDLTSTDISTILRSLRGVIETTRVMAPHSQRRHLELLIAGLRPTHGPFADDLHAKAMTETQARRITRTRPQQSITSFLKSTVRPEFDDANSDYDSACTGCLEELGAAITWHAAVMVLGDGRGNRRDHGPDAFEEITRRGRETVWPTPEARYSWTLEPYDPPDQPQFCDRVQVVRDRTGPERASLASERLR